MFINMDLVQLNKPFMWILVCLSSLTAFALIFTFVNNLRFESSLKKLKTGSIYNELQEHKILKKDGYDIHFFVSGDKENELLIFLPAAFCDHTTFDYQVAYFSKNFRVITIDLLGHGLSQVSKSDDKIDVSAAHLLEIMSQEGYEKAHLIGVSMGSLIAQHFAYLHPDKVQSVTVTGGYNIHGDNDEIAAAQKSERIKWFLKIITSMDAFRRYVATLAVIKPEEQAKIYRSTKNFTRRSFMVMPGLQKIDKLEKISVRSYPLLILVGDHDIDISIKYAQKWHKEDPDTQFHIIKNAGHNANLDNPEDFNKILTEFIQRHNASTIL